ncbi:MAG: hypothetical protein II453_04720 [Alphaproteobacteria bacterium]|nr:hypothetical protein [Alphaproteobacteria bacterium]
MNTEKKTVSEMKQEINRLYGEIAAVENEIINTNTATFVAEVRNLLDGVGEGFVERDYYADARYYSIILGVKNIRINTEDSILVKIESASGYLLPKEIVIDGKIYNVAFVQSKNYIERLDY